jgi:hypothetical protein
VQEGGGSVLTAVAQVFPGIVRDGCHFALRIGAKAKSDDLPPYDKASDCLRLFLF